MEKKIDPDANPDAFVAVATTLVKTISTEKILAALQDIDSPHRQARILATIAKVLITLGRKDEAVKVVDAARSATQGIVHDYERPRTFARIAEVEAMLGLLLKARETAALCTSSDDRLTAYTTILREYHIGRNPSLAKLFEEEPQKED